MKFSRSALFHLKTRAFLKYFVNDCRLKSDIDKLDIGKLETTLADLSKLSNLVEKEVVEKTTYDKLV